MKRFNGKTIVVTGAGRGIGSGVAERFAEEGANLVLADRDPRVAEAADKIKKFDVDALPVTCDVTSKAEVEDLYEPAAGVPWHYGKRHLPRDYRNRRVGVQRRALGEAAR